MVICNPDANGVYNKYKDWRIIFVNYKDEFPDHYNHRFAELYLVQPEVDVYRIWGDDWDDAPYEHNAGAPYNHYKGNINDTFKVAVIPVMLPVFDTPNEKKFETFYQCYYDSPYCWKDIMHWKAPMFDFVFNDEDEVFYGDTLNDLMCVTENLGHWDIEEY